MGKTEINRVWDLIMISPDADRKKMLALARAVGIVEKTK